MKLHLPAHNLDVEGTPAEVAALIAALSNAPEPVETGPESNAGVSIVPMLTSAQLETFEALKSLHRASISVLAQRMGLTHQVVSSRLGTLKKLGLAHNPAFGVWEVLDDYDLFNE